MKQIPKEVFLEMLRLNILNGNNKGQKNFTVTGKNKGKSKRKHHYVSSQDYLKYARLVSSNSSNSNQKSNPRGS